LVTLGNSAIRTYLAAKDAGDIMALEQSDEYLFIPGVDDDAEDVLSGLGVRLMLQAMSTNGQDPPVLQQDGELPQAIIASPKIKVIGDDLRTNHLTSAGRESCRALGLIHILADELATRRGVFVVGHGFTLERAPVGRADAKKKVQWLSLTHTKFI
jgi:hypothetical protein